MCDTDMRTTIITIHPEQRLNTHPFSIGVGKKTLRKRITQARIATSSITGKTFACVWHRYANYNTIHPEQRLNTHTFSIGVGKKTLRKRITQARIATSSITGKTFARVWHRYANYNTIHPEQRLNTHTFSIGVGKKTLRKRITQARIATSSMTGKTVACVTTICELQLGLGSSSVPLRSLPGLGRSVLHDSVVRQHLCVWITTSIYIQYHLSLI